MESRNLPTELWSHVTSHLPLNSLLTLKLVSKELNEVSSEAILDYILTELSQLNLTKAKAFLKYFWQTHLYFKLKQKCIEQPEKLSPKELFCFMLTRDGNNRELYAKLHKDLTYALAINEEKLTSAALLHLNIIQLALTISLHVDNALLDKNYEAIKKIGEMGSYDDITLNNISSRIIDLYASRDYAIKYSAACLKINLLHEPEVLLTKIKEVLSNNKNPHLKPFLRDWTAVHRRIFHHLRTLCEKREDNFY